MKTDQLRIFKHFWTILPVGQQKGGRGPKRHRKKFFMIIPAVLIIMAYTIPLVGCANTPTTYDKSIERSLKYQKHERGGRGRGA